MIIRKDESIDILEILQAKLKFDYAWLVYDDSKDVLHLADMHFFRKLEDAKKFRAQNEPGVQDIILIEPVVAHIKNSLQIYNKEKDRTVIYPDTVRIELSSLKIYTAEQARTRERAENLGKELTEWGFKHDLTNILVKTMQGPLVPMVINSISKIRGDRMDTLLFLAPDKNREFRIEGITCNLKRNIKIPDLTVGSINTKKLEKEMNLVKWGKLHPLLPDLLMSEKEHKRVLNKAMEIHDRLESLSIIKEGKEIADKLMAKFWLGTEMEGLIDKVEELNKRFVITQNFDRIGNSIFTEREAYNLMCDRYVSKEIVEGNKVLSPWYYRHAEAGASFSNIVRISLSEFIDMNAQVDKLIADNYQFEYSREDLIKMLRRGDEVKVDEMHPGYKHVNEIYFNPFLNEIEVGRFGPKQNIDLSQDQDLNLGKGKSI